MPLCQIHILEGRDEETKARLIKEMTDTICRTLNAPPEAVRILISEMPKTHWGIGGKTAKELGR
ncbi:MAG: 2-hydroxymuconate tautomerase family protein [Ectothiorhodospiraceae bacterium]|nr:2-hydroxymuconate tautomerase family protein [Ectothiorhodospiraceae bacterium]